MIPRQVLHLQQAAAAAAAVPPAMITTTQTKTKAKINPTDQTSTPSSTQS